MMGWFKSFADLSFLNPGPVIFAFFAKSEKSLGENNSKIVRPMFLLIERINFFFSWLVKPGITKEKFSLILFEFPRSGETNIEKKLEPNLIRFL